MESVSIIENANAWKNLQGKNMAEELKNIEEHNPSLILYSKEHGTGIQNNWL
ncbi:MULTISPECIES: hypothetical protein [unclassified Oleiphilus]|uniref:hypothetical protein n=1 Tax=unclassified Oleiphilus TaxID=2631174 RepID=UPI000AC80B93|nr:MULTISPECIES: hypothetical protein [unclassified Oleiphilus]